jgi:ferritin-like metal-binding protein YciE
MSMQEKTLKARSDILQQYVSDMMAVEEHIGTAVKRQAEDKDVSKNNPQASQLIQQIARHTEQHAQRLKEHLEAIGGDPAKGIKEVATAALGAVAGMYDKIRSEKVSKMLRDDYTALNLAAVGYSMLHTTGLAVQDHATAALALRHLKDYTSIIMELNSAIPSIVVAELKDNDVVIVESSVRQAVQNTQDAWKPSSNGNGDTKTQI